MPRSLRMLCRRWTYTPIGALLLIGPLVITPTPEATMTRPTARVPGKSPTGGVPKTKPLFRDFIDECFATLRGPSELINIHSGGHLNRTRLRYFYQNDQWHCGQINIPLALTDILELADGPTVVIPGSHKSQIVHPTFAKGYENMLSDPPELVEGAVPVYLKSGDAVLFVDATCHGGASRIKPGLRRTLVYRYGPHWGSTRLGYRYSDELIARLTPERAKILQPVPIRKPPAEKE